MNKQLIKLLLTITILLILGCQSKQELTQPKVQTINKSNIDSIIKKYNKKIHSKEIIVSVMNSKTGQILYVSNPKSATQLEYEAGSVISPLTIALALNNGKITIKTKVDTYQGDLKIGKFHLKDSYRFTKDKISIKEILTHSSNIGTAIIAHKLSAKEFYDGYKSFGLSTKTGIDIENENIGMMPNLYKYQNYKLDKNNKLVLDDSKRFNIFKAISSYGQGITVTHMQLLKAYNVFNNNGILLTPFINNSSTTKIQVIKPIVANNIKDILINVVQNGTAQKAIIKDVEIGGKTGVANIVENGKYVNKYISSFFGFANYKNDKYTIGVTVIEPTSKNNNHYASNSAVLVFKEVVKKLIE